ncbi:MAG: sulfotransferase [Deltaproteobacteria bacterium]|nr:sulfotransferase [Deltaproteobacteria bacterium]
MDRFIVGTGRCGSTLLSQMLAEDPDVLSIFEFFNGLDVMRRFGTAPVSGADFAALISAEQPFVTAVLRRGYPVAEITYPFGPTSRFQPDDPLPWILVSALPRLDPDPDRLFDAVVEFATHLPMQHLSRHYCALFDWLASTKDRELWIERSGSSIDYLGSLHAFFPNARFLQIHRDGREAALSMREHHAYRLPIAILYQSGGPPAFDLHADPEDRDLVSRILASRPPVEYYGRYWNDQIANGFRAIDGIAPEHYRAIRFEDLVSDPRTVLGEVCEFFSLDRWRGDWIERAVTRVRGVPPLRAPELGAEERALLDEVCRPGQALLGRD